MEKTKKKDVWRGYYLYNDSQTFNQPLAVSRVRTDASVAQAFSMPQCHILVHWTLKALMFLALIYALRYMIYKSMTKSLVLHTLIVILHIHRLIS